MKGSAIRFSLTIDENSAYSGRSSTILASSRQQSFVHSVFDGYFDGGVLAPMLIDEVKAMAISLATMASPFRCKWILQGSELRVSAWTTALCIRVAGHERVVSEEECARCPLWEDRDRCADGHA